MNTPSQTVDPVARVPRDRGPIASLAFGLLAGPTAWFLQLCAGYGLSSWPCFPTDERRLLPIQHYEWTSSAVLIASVIAFILALMAGLTAGRTYRALQHNFRSLTDVRTDDPIAAAIVGRTRFLALWGMVCGAAFAAAIAFTGLALAVLPRCAG